MTDRIRNMLKTFICVYGAIIFYRDGDNLFVGRGQGQIFWGGLRGTELLLCKHKRGAEKLMTADHG